MDSNQVKATVCVLKVLHCFGPWEGFEFVGFYKNWLKIFISQFSDTYPATYTQTSDGTMQKAHSKDCN